MPISTDQDYIINTGPQGTFNKSGNYQTVPEDIDRMFVRWENEQARKIALYFHGGLVNETTGLETARRLGPLLLQAGNTPVCFVWETGLMETIGANLSKISETKLFRKLLIVLLKKVAQKLGFDSPLGRGVAGTMPTDAEIETELAKPRPFDSYERNTPPQEARSAVNIVTLAGNPLLEDDLRAELRGMIEADPEFVSAVQQTKVTVNATGNDNGARGFVSIISFIAHAAKIAYRVITRFIKKRDHDLYPTVVEEILREFYIAEIGAWVWKGMKDKADEGWQSNTGRSGLNQYAGRYFLDKLSDYVGRYPDTQVNLVGHSAGSIMICELLKYTAGLAKPITYHHILFMAPACRIDLFKTEMLDHPGRYTDIRIFTMEDAKECKDALVPYFYTHSLLYLIAGILEDEGESYDAYILGLQRHIAFTAPYDIAELSPTHEYLYAAGVPRISFSVCTSTDPVAMQTGALSHGGFDDDVPTLNSIAYILSR